MRISNIKLFLLGSLFLLNSCGYKLTGGSLSSLPARIRTITVPVFKNTSGEPNIEQVVTNAVIQKFQAIGKPRLVEAGKADAIVMGTITKYVPNRAISFNSAQNAREYRMEIFGDVVIKEVATGKILWERKGIYSKREYSLGSQLSVTKSRELETKKLTAFEFARDLAVLLEGL